MSHLIFIACGIFSCQDNFRSLLILTRIISYISLLLNLGSCFDLNQANQRWLQIGSLSDSNANAMLRLQIAKLSDRIPEGRSVFLRSPELLFLQQQQQQRNLPKKMKADSFEREQRDNNRQLAYLVSPFSEQVLEIGKQLSEGLISPNSILEDRYRLLNEDLLKQFVLKSSESSRLMDDECRTIRSTVKLEKDDIEKVTGKVIRTCKGLVQVNKCEGSCTSTVQPSIKSPSGFIKECNCCNEGSFKRVQVRLLECFSAFDNQRIATNDNEDKQLKSFMDIEVEEPIDCRCRRCAGLL